MKFSFDRLKPKVDKALSLLEKLEEYSSDFPVEIDYDKIYSLRRDFEKFKEKFEKGIFEVAVVGTESSGKSTFLNALIENDILPRADRRMTYAITQIVYSDTPTAEVHFLTREEFTQKLRQMLAEIGYPNAYEQTLESLRMEEIEKVGEKFSSSEVNSVINDLKSMVNGKREIKRLLDRGIETMSPEQARSFITDEYKSLAIKTVIIKSPALEKFKNIIMYDLPGFDSPAIRHSKYTQQKMKEVDAIVYIRPAHKPSINKPEVDMILSPKMREEGSYLTEKLFFFLNQADMLSSSKALQENFEVFMNELKKYNLNVPEYRVIFGSALAYLEEKGVVPSEINASERLKGLGITSGIEELKKKLEEYNEKERIPNLEKKINRRLEELHEIIDTLEKILQSVADPNTVRKNYVGLVKETYDKLMLDITEKGEGKLARFKNFEVLKIKNEKAISKQLIERIRNMDLSISDKEKDQIKTQLAAEYVREAEVTEEYAKRLREVFRRKLQSKLAFLEDVLVAYLQEINRKFAEKLLEVMEADKDEWDKLLEKLVELLDREFPFAKGHEIIKVITQRYTRPFVEIMKHRVGSTDRVNVFKTWERDIYSLFAYNENFDPYLPLPFEGIKNELIYQEEMVNWKGFKEMIEEIFKKYPGLEKYVGKETLALQLVSFLFKKSRLDKMVNLSKQTISALLELVTEKLDEIMEELQTSQQEQATANSAKNTAVPSKSKSLSKKSFSSKILDSIERHLSLYWKNPEDRLEEERADALSENIEVTKTHYASYEEVEKEIEKDAEIIKKILTETVVNALGLEETIVDVLTYYYEILVDKIKSPHTKDNPNIFWEFIVNNIALIAPSKIEKNAKKELEVRIANEILGKICELKAELSHI